MSLGPPAEGTPRLLPLLLTLRQESGTLVWMDRFLQWDKGLEVRLNLLLPQAMGTPQIGFPDFREHSIEPDDLVRLRFARDGAPSWSTDEQDWPEQRRVYLVSGTGHNRVCEAEYWLPGLALDPTVGSIGEPAPNRVTLDWHGANIHTWAVMPSVDPPP